MPSRPDPAALIDTHRYPVQEIDTATRFVREARDGLATQGVAMLPGFLTTEATDAMCAECALLESAGHFSEVMGTPYLGLPDQSYAASHPRRAQVRSALTAVAYDLIGGDSTLRALYEWDPLLDLMSMLLDRSPLYRYADPFGALNIAAMSEGDELGWHFDQTDFVVSIALQSSHAGGDFQSATRIRSADDEHYDAVEAVLAGSTDAIVHVPMRPGTLMLFEGRYSMHRVTPIVGPRPRYVALLAYDTRQDADSSELLKLVRYGRLPA